MKNLLTPILGVCFLVLLSQSCSDDADSRQESLFSAAIDGIVYHTEGKSTAYAKDFNGGIAINGILDINEGISIYIKIPHGTDPGTYPFSDKTFGLIWKNGQPWSTTELVGTGSITIDEHDDQALSGSFDFTAYNPAFLNHQRVVKEGEFRVALGSK